MITSSILHRCKYFVDVVIDETMIESRRCVLLPKYISRFCCSGNQIEFFFAFAVVQEEMFFQCHTCFQSLMTLPRIIQSGYTGRNM